ncbi:MAG: phosphatidate cytidylyltransferase [Gammaproteobacteria bacterium]|nr:phosphatidate cytidylyltransferase [Gammaproteobacteria bacterium]MDE0273871.1 phosphatidate cytidylyltransferase [Gammaproteobacteria bacterium]
MLKSRVITAVGLALVALAVIYLLPPPGFALAVGAVATLAAWEWARFAGLTMGWQRATYAAAIPVLGLATLGRPGLHEATLWVGLAAWAVAILLILIHRSDRTFSGWRWVAALLGLAILSAAWSAAMTLRMAPSGVHWLVWLFVLVSAVDIGAYFAGTTWGRRKLAPALSPAKTWEGVAGGAILGILVCGGALAALGLLSVAAGAIIALLIAISVFGDLLESLLKRQSGVKDSGTLLPGHGGLLDRIDSELAALPVFALLLPFV